MNKLEYIPGDFVMTNGVPIGTAKDVVYRVISSDPTKTLVRKDGTVQRGVVCLENIEGTKLGDKGFLFGDCTAWVKDIVPIPLTPEILEKNGWKRDGKWYCLSTKRAYLYTIQDTGQPDEFLICAGECKHNLTSVSFVHQLQHFLFGLNLNSDLEV